VSPTIADTFADRASRDALTAETPGTLLAALGRAIVDATAVGDARVAHTALIELLSSAATSGAAARRGPTRTPLTTSRRTDDRRQVAHLANGAFRKPEWVVLVAHWMDL